MLCLVYACGTSAQPRILAHDTHASLHADSVHKLAPRCNGHLLLNSEKMSKSTGNFKTLSDVSAPHGGAGCQYLMIRCCLSSFPGSRASNNALPHSTGHCRVLSRCDALGAGRRGRRAGRCQL